MRLDKRFIGCWPLCRPRFEIRTKQCEGLGWMFDVFSYCPAHGIVTCCSLFTELGCDGFRVFCMLDSKGIIAES